VLGRWGAGLKKKEEKKGKEPGEAGWAGPGEARVEWAALGRAGPFRPGRSYFFLLKLEIHFGASNKIGKMQIRYHWIRREKCFNVRSNL
jgi:hypothetical protein